MIRVDVADRVARLRDDFDRSFAEPARVLDGETVELLAVRAGDRPYAIRLDQSSGLYPDRPVTALPTTVRALLGVAGFAGTVIPVYDLAALLAHPVPQHPRWLLLTHGEPPLAVAFHHLDRHLRVPVSEVIGGAADDDRQGCVRGMVRLPDGDRPIVDVPAARALVHQSAGYRPVPEENR